MKAILEMELPESCDKCKIRHWIDDDNSWCNLVEDYVEKFSKERYPDCSLKIVEERQDCYLPIPKNNTRQWKKQRMIECVLL